MENTAISLKNNMQVRLCVCPAAFPVSFALHAWFEVFDGDTTNRYEVLHFKNFQKQFIHINFYPAKSGIRKWIWGSAQLHDPSTVKCLAIFEGEIARQIAQTLQESLSTYPAIDRYRLWGPNSNSYVAWILAQSPKVQVTLPGMALGKRYWD